MPRSNIVITRQPSPQMKLPHHMHQTYQSPIHQHTSTVSLSHSTASDLHSIPDNFVHHSYVPHKQDVQQIHPFVKTEQVAVPSVIPNSVKGAPSHLRPAIRKRQNSESAKRSRQRRKEAAKIFYRRFDDQCRRLASLEQKVATLLKLVQEADEDRSSEPKPKQEQGIVEAHTPSQDAQQPLEQHQTSVVHSVVSMPTPYEEEQEDNGSNSQILFEEDQQDNGSNSETPFEDDLEALLETCTHSNVMFGDC